MIILKTTQERLLSALQGVAGIVERRHTLPILAHVLIRKIGEGVEFTSSDLEMQVRSTADLGGKAADFATTVAARKLTDILQAMPADQGVTLSAQPNRLVLQGGRSRFTLQTLSAADFPLVLPSADLGPPFAVPQAVLRDLLAQVEFAMAAQDIRYFLNGVLFIAEGKLLRMVATDGNRLALAEASLAVAVPSQQVILPRKAVHELQRQLREAGASTEQGMDPGRSDGAGGAGTERGSGVGGEEGGEASGPGLLPMKAQAQALAQVQIQFSPAQARFQINATEFVTKLIEGRFPDFERVIPKGHPHAVSVARLPLLAALQRAAILTSEKFKGIRLKLEPGALHIAARNAESEESDEDLEVDYSGPSLEIGLNVNYLLDMLGSTDAEQVDLSLRDAGSSVLFTLKDRPGFRYVVSPMRL